MTWFRESLHPEIEEGLRVDESIYDGRTEFQSVRIFRNDLLGRVLVLDNVVQTTELDEFFYHEMLAHVPILGHGAARRVLVIGGGDGGCLKQVLRHPVERVTMVELDRDVIALCRAHLPALSDGAFDDPRLRLVIGDGTAFVAETGERYDVIIVDSTDPIGPAVALFETPFYRDCRDRLAPGGVLVTQNGVPAFQQAEFEQSLAAFRALFAHSGFYYAAVPTYFGGDLAFGWASDGLRLNHADSAQLRDRYAARELRTRYYNPEIHQAAFAQPNYLKALGA